MSVAPPPDESPRVVPLFVGILAGGAVGGALVGATDAVVAGAALGRPVAWATVAVCALLGGIAGTLGAAPWAAALCLPRWRSLPGLAENPRWWGVGVGAAVVAILLLLEARGGVTAALAATPLLAVGVATAALPRTGRSRIFTMAGLIASLSLWAVVEERPGPLGWPEGGTPRSVLLVTVDGLRATDVAQLPPDGAWARWTERGVAVSRVLAPQDDRAVALRGLWRGTAAWSEGGLSPGAGVTMATSLSRAGWAVEGILGDNTLADPGLTERRDDAGWLPQWPHTGAAGLLGAGPHRARARRVVATALKRLAHPTPRPRVIWVHLADSAFPWEPPPPWDTAFYAGDPWDPGRAAPLPPAVTAQWPDVVDPAWVTAQRAGALASVDDALRDLAEAVPTDGSWAVVAVGLAGARPWPAEDGPLDAVTGAAVLWAPGLLPPGATVDAPVELTDIAGTLAELAGAPSKADGRASLVPLAFGRRPRALARTAPGGVPQVVSADATWSPADGPAPDETWEAAARTLRAALQQGP